MLALSNIAKRFGATLALDDVSLEIGRGEIIGLVGENGAGKTTLMRIAAGEIAPDSGSVRATGAIGFVHQHFLLVNEFTIAENLDLAGVRNDTAIELPPLDRRVAELSVGERANLELVKALARRPEVLILDEPTAVLTPLETEELFAVMRRYASSGTAIVFISHKINEVIAIATRVVVMRRGQIVAERTELDASELATLMTQTGGAPSAERRAPKGGLKPRGSVLGSRSSELSHPGSIVAIIGVAGNGQMELMAKLRDELRDAGFIPEDRTRDGVIAEMSVADNLLLGGATNAAELIEKFAIRTTGPQQRADALSGGNQQKVVLARELSKNPATIVAAEPTRGLDFESTRFVHEQLRMAAERGAAVLLITSDLDEAFALASTIRVMYRGTLSDPLTPEEAAERAPRLMAGVT